MPLPPGPRTTLLPILGFLRDPYGATLRAHRRYGDTYRFQTAVGPLVLTGDPDGVSELLGADPDLFAPFGVDLLANVIGENSLLMLGGARHRAARKLLAPPFAGARMRAYGQTMRAITVAETARWPAGRPFALQPTTQAISLQVIIQSVFGVTAPAEVARYQAALLDVVHTLQPSFIFVPALQRPLWPAWRRFQAASQRIERLIVDEVRARRHEGRRGEDILSLLLDARYDDGAELGEREIFEQLMTLLVAGHESTAIAIAWACHLVHTHAAVEARLLAELRGLGEAPESDAIARLPYLEAVCHETLRLKPLATSFARKLRRPWSLRGYALPAGMGVGVSVLRVHRQERLYPDAEEFRPERFLDGRSFGPHEYLPFGGGSRRCLGAAFAIYEMKMVLATIVARFTLRSAESGPVRTIPRNTFVGPRGGIRVTSEPRAVL
jgi:cytochrome P450